MAPDAARSPPSSPESWRLPAAKSSSWRLRCEQSGPVADRKTGAHPRGRVTPGAGRLTAQDWVRSADPTVQLDRFPAPTSHTQIVSNQCLSQANETADSVSRRISAPCSASCRAAPALKERATPMYPDWYRFLTAPVAVDKFTARVAVAHRGAGQSCRRMCSPQDA